MANPNGHTEIEQLGPDYTVDDEELEFDFDPKWGKGDLVPFNADAGAIKVNMGGRDKDSAADVQYSGIIRYEQKFDFSIIVNFTRDYVPDTHAGKMIVQQGTSLGLWLMRCPALQRGRSLEHAEQQARQWTKRMGAKDKRTEQLDAVDKHLAKWARANMVQSRIRVDRLIYGLDYVDNDQCIHDWFLADRQMRESMRQAIEELSTEGLQVFLAKVDMHQLLRAEMEDRAEHLPREDLSEWLEALKEEETTQAQLLLGAPWIIQEAAIFAMENQGAKNPHKLHLGKDAGGDAASGQPQEAGSVPKSGHSRHTPDPACRRRNGALESVGGPTNAE